MNRARLAAWAPVLVAAVLGFGGAGRWTLWQDEAFTWLLVQRDWAGLVDGAAQDRHPPLFYLLAALFQPLGDRDWALRLPSVLGFVAAVALLNRVPGPGRSAAWIVALSPVALLFAHTARMYAVLLGAGAGMLLAGLALAAGPRPGRAAVGMALGAAVAIWTHYVGLAAVAGAGLGTVLALAAARPTDLGRRFGMLVAAMAVAGLSFLPWALGPLQFQLGAKNVPGERTLAVLHYLWWAFDGRIPPLSWALGVGQLVGLVVVIRRRDALGGMLLGQVAAALLLPYLFSNSVPAQNPRNYLQFLPAAALVVAVGFERFAGAPRARLAGLLTLVVLAADPLLDLWTRPVSPQEPGTGFDYQVEADVLDASVPPNGGLFFRPTYLLTQYQRYAPPLADRTRRRVDRHAWLAISRAEWIDSAVSARYTEECTFKVAYRFVLYAARGPGCDAANRWMAEVAAQDGYVPFLQELARRAMVAGDATRAEAYALQAARTLRAHPAAFVTLAEARIRLRDGDGALDAADRALDIARTWHLGNGAIAQGHQLRAQALGVLGREADAKAAAAAATCARRHAWPTVCGQPWESAFGWMEPLPLPPAVLPPLPALTESQAPTPPAEAPAGATRHGLWAFDGEVLPEGWIDAAGSAAAPSAGVEEVEGAGALVLTTGEDRSVALACGPLVPADPRVALRLRWRFSVGGGEGRTVAQVEARFADATGAIQKVGGVPVQERPLQTATATSWRVDRFDLRPPVGTAQVRLCAKVEGTLPARFAVDWAELAGVAE